MDMKVIVIGAGAAGLYAANLLKAEDIEVTVLEARPEPGGRIQTVYDFADFPIEKGAAYSHGDNHLFYELASYREVPIEPSEGKGYYYWKGQLLSRKEARKIDEVREALGVFEGIYQYKGPDLPLSEVLQEPKPEGPIRPILDGLAFEYGTDFGELGAASLAYDERLWPSAGGDFYFPKGLQPVFEEFMADLGEDLHCSHIVTQIDYSGKGVKVTCRNGKSFEADRLILTVPLSVLKSRTLQFEPPLPSEKVDAIEQLGIGAGMKVFLQFNERFWPEDLQVICGGMLCPWYETVPNAPKDAPVLKAYPMGEYARNLSARGSQAAGLLVEELNGIFGDAKPASAFVKSYTADWAKEPHIWGAYSYAGPHSLGKREQLWKPLDGKLFFAGEASHFKGCPATVQGAMETGEWAVEKILSY